MGDIKSLTQGHVLVNALHLLLIQGENRFYMSGNCCMSLAPAFISPVGLNWKVRT